MDLLNSAHECVRRSLLDFLVSDTLPCRRPLLLLLLLLLLYTPEKDMVIYSRKRCGCILPLNYVWEIEHVNKTFVEHYACFSGRKDQEPVPKVSKSILWKYSFHIIHNFFFFSKAHDFRPVYLTASRGIRRMFLI